jgi:hypothetical protein
VVAVSAEHDATLTNGDPSPVDGSTDEPDPAGDEPSPAGGSAGDEPDPEPVGEPAYEAPRIATGAAAVSALFATVVLSGAVLPVLAPAGFGAFVTVLGTVSGRRRAVTLGVAMLFVGLLLAGAEGARPPVLLLGAVGTAVAYDAGRYAIRLGDQLRGGAPTARAELVHVGATATVATATAGVGAVVFRVATGGQPSTALVALLLATVLFVWALLR